MSGRLPIVTDHALIRYLERARDVDVARLRRRIARIAKTALDHDAEAVIVDGVRFVVVDGRVVTVTEKPSHRERRQKRRRKPPK